MNPFPDRLHYDDAGFSISTGRRRICTTDKFRAITSLGTIEVPAGTFSDGGSIPAAAAPAVGTGFDDFLEDYVVHDFLYSKANTEFSRAEADLILKETLWNRFVAPQDSFRERAAKFSRLMSIYLAVRMFGGAAWRNNRRR